MAARDKNTNEVVTQTVSQMLRYNSVVAESKSQHPFCVLTTKSLHKIV